jgi:uncharacterized protein YbjT (DUF2867 family)
MILKLLPFFLVYALALTIALRRRGLGSAGRRPTVGSPAPTPQRVLVVGATGGTGRQLVIQALERGLEVTALVRDPARLQMEHPRLRVAVGDVLDPPTLQAALQGQEAVLSALGHRRYFAPGRILSEGTANVLRAMEACGVRRLVCETALGIGDSAGRLGLYYTLFVIPVILPLYFWDKARQERRIAASHAEWVIVRPAALTDRPQRGQVQHGPAVGSYVRTVSIPRADVAAFMLDQLTDSAHVGTAVGIC